MKLTGVDLGPLTIGQGTKEIVRFLLQFCREPCLAIAPQYSNWLVSRQRHHAAVDLIHTVVQLEVVLLERRENFICELLSKRRPVAWNSVRLFI